MAPRGSREKMDSGLDPCTFHLASRESSVFPFHPAQIFPTTSVAFSYLLRICFGAQVSPLGLTKGQWERIAVFAAEGKAGSTLLQHRGMGDQGHSIRLSSGYRFPHPEPGEAITLATTPGSQKFDSLHRTAAPRPHGGSVTSSQKNGLLAWKS